MRLWVMNTSLSYISDPTILPYGACSHPQGGGGMGIFHMPSDFFFQQLVDPPPSFLMRYVLVTCYVLFETALRKVRL